MRLLTGPARPLLYALVLFLALGGGQAYALPATGKQKAEYIHRFIKLIAHRNWNKFPPSHPLRLCAATETVVYEHLEALRGERAHNREVVLVPLNQNSRPECHVVYVGSNTSLINPYTERGILTIGEHKDFLSEGGLVHLFEEDEQLRFSLADRRLAVLRFEIEPSLLKLAKRGPWHNLRK